MHYEELWQYDGNDNIVRYTNKKGALTTFEYNALNHNTRVGGDASDPGGSGSSCGGTSVNGKEGCYEYDGKGNISKFTDAEGLVTINEYDNMYSKTAEIKGATGLNIQTRWSTIGWDSKFLKLAAGGIKMHSAVEFIKDFPVVLTTYHKPNTCQKIPCMKLPHL